MYEFIDAEYATSGAAPAITRMCRWLEVSKSGYLRMAVAAGKRDGEKEGGTQAPDQEGFRRLRRDLRLPARVRAQLARWGVRAGLELVRALMRELGLVACQPRPWRPSTTAAGRRPGRSPDLVNRDFSAEAPGQKMVGDITYIPTWEGWALSRYGD